MATKRISCLAALGNRNDQISFIDYRVTVTEFRGIFYLNVGAAEFFYDIFSHQACSANWCRRQ